MCRNMGVLTLDSYIRHMPHSAYMKLASMMDPGRLWEKFAAKIPMSLANVDVKDAETRYTHQQIEVFGLMSQKGGMNSSPTRQILTEWGTKNAKVHHLIQVLESVELFAASQYLLSLLRQDSKPLVSSQTPNNPIPPTPLPETDAEGSKSSELALADSFHHEERENFPSMGSDGTLSDRLSYGSSAQNSVGDEDAVPFSKLQRRISAESEDDKDYWIGLDDIEIQTIAYEMLRLVTNDFNDEILEKGGNLIGSGGFGKVYLGTFRNGFRVAAKCLMHSEQMKKEDLVKQFENEVKTLSTYRHTNVVHLLGYSIDGPSHCLVYQYLPNGSLEDRLASHQGTPPLSASLRLKIVKGTADGIQYLNDNKHVHRDIKSANILLDSEFTAKVGDFATVMIAPSGDSKTVANASVVIGTTAYLAPEAFTFEVSTKLDSYSFGVVLLEVITGLPAHDPKREDPTLRSHIFENIDEPSEIHDYVDRTAGDWGKGVVDGLYSIAERCLETSKKRRPNVKDIQPDLEKL